MDFLHYDNPIMVEYRKLVDCILVGLLWIFASIPLFTFGAASTAMYYTLERRVHTDEEKLWTTFWLRFKKEFKQATLLTLISIVITVLVGISICLLWQEHIHILVFALLFAVVLFTIGWMQLWYAYLSRFDDTNRMLLGNTFQIAVSCMPKTLLLAVFFVAIVAAAEILLFNFPGGLLLLPGIYGGVSNIIHRKIFRPYMPESLPCDASLPDKAESSEIDIAQ